jgi:hypothetical protein
MVRRLASSALAAVCLVTCTGCEPICSGPLGAYCPDGVQQKALNRRPLPTLDGGFTIAGRHLPLTAVPRGGTLDFRADYEDPDGDPLYYEWDLDGRGGFERAGYRSTTSATYGTVGLLRVRLRVSDFPWQRGVPGAPGVVEEERSVLVFDPDRNHRPRAGFSIDPSQDIPVATYFVGQPVFLDASPSRDEDDWDRGRLSYAFSARQGDVGAERITPPGSVSRYAIFRLDRPGRWTIALDVTDAAGEHDRLERTVEVFTATPGGDQAPVADFRISPGFPALREPVTLDAGGSRDPDGRGINSYEWDLDGDGSFETASGAQLHTHFDVPGPRLIGLRVWDGFLRDVVYKEFDAQPFQEGGGPSSPVASGARTPGLPFSARLSGRPLSAGHVSGAELVDVLGRGRLHARVLGAPRSVTRFLNAPWRTRASFSPRGADAIALAMARGGAACLRIGVTGETGTLEVQGGPGIRATATFRFRVERDGSATVLGHLRTRTARKRPLPAICRRLVSRPRR